MFEVSLLSVFLQGLGGLVDILQDVGLEVGNSTGEGVETVVMFERESIPGDVRRLVEERLD